MPTSPSVILLEGPPALQVKLRRLKGAKRLTLRVSATTGEATLTLPPRFASAEAQAFVRSREEWLRAHMPEHRALAFGDSVPLFGVPHRLLVQKARGVRHENGVIFANEGRPLGPSLAAYLKELARAQLVAASDHYAQRLGLSYAKISLRDTRSRWGSCTSARDLMYNWRLIMAPPEVLRYVAAHEVAHLQEMNHSQDFWDVVAKLMPDWQPKRAWLKQEGSQLQLIRFTP